MGKKVDENKKSIKDEKIINEAKEYIEYYLADIKRKEEERVAKLLKRGRIQGELYRMIILNNEYELELLCDQLLQESKELENDIKKDKEQIAHWEGVISETLYSRGNQLEFVKKSLDNAKKIVMGKDENGNDKTYLDVMLGQRIEGPNNAGSSYNISSPEELYNKLISQDWRETTHPDVMPGCRVFKTNLAGLEGILDLDKLPDDIELYAIDPKGTGKVGMGAGNVQKNPVEETYLIIGKENIDGKEEDVVFTFHPGEPVRPSMVETSELSDGEILTKEDAIYFGFNKVKYLSEEMLEQYRRKQKEKKLQSAINETKKIDSEIEKPENEKETNNIDDRG